MKAVTARLMGRLGNQLFQHSVALAYALRTGRVYCACENTANNHVWMPYRWPKLKYDCGFLENEYHLVYKEPKHSFVAIPDFEEGLVMLEGYFQSYKYFDFYRDEVLKAFGFDDIKTEDGVCSIHVRMGDYRLYPTKHPIISREYISKAMWTMFEAGVRKYKVFSDEPDAAKEMIGVSEEGIEVEYSIGKTELEDLREMASCQYNIIANSSFSWWAAYLNPNPNKIVVTPHEENWFGSDNKHLEVCDLIPQSWTRIKYKA